MSGRVRRQKLTRVLLLLALLATSFEIVHAQYMRDEVPYEEGIYYEAAPPDWRLGEMLPMDDIKAIDPAPASAWLFQGEVYEGDVGNDSRPLQGVTVYLYGANNPYPDTGVLIGSTTTDEDGRYELEASGGYEFYSIREENLLGYESVNANAVDGKIRNNDWIEYVIPLEMKRLIGNKFWDVRPATGLAPGGADLAILSADWQILEQEDDLVFYVDIENLGEAESKETRVRVWDSKHGWLEGSYSIPALAPDDTTTAEIWLEIPEDLRGSMRIFIVEVYPVAEEPNEENNRQNIEVWIPSQRAGEPQPGHPKSPDLAILSADWQILEQEDDLVFYVDIENLGEAESKETRVRVWDSKHGWLEGSYSIPALAPDDTTTAEIWLEIPEDMRGSTHTFIIEVYPVTGEADEENNVARLPGIFIQKMKVQPEDSWKDMLPNEGIRVVLVATVALGALGSISLRHRRVRIRLRKEWQVKAEEGEPPEECLPCNHYCQKKPELEPSLCKIADLDLVAYDPISGERIGKIQLESDIVDCLNKAVGAYRFRRNREKLREMVVPLSQALLQHIGGWLQGESLHDVSIVGRLKGYKVSCQFILWHCEKVNEWVRKEEWKAVIEQKSDKSVGTLQSFDPAEPDMLEPELTQQLIQFIENA